MWKRTWPLENANIALFSLRKCLQFSSSTERNINTHSYLLKACFFLAFILSTLPFQFIRPHAIPYGDEKAMM